MGVPKGEDQFWVTNSEVIEVVDKMIVKHNISVALSLVCQTRRG